MGQDTLSDVLRAIRLRSAVFFYVSCGGRWAAEAPAGQDVAAAVMPGADHVIEYHVVTTGECWAAIVGEPPLKLRRGDILLLPHGDAHVLSSAPGMRADPNLGWYHEMNRRQRPFHLAYEGPGESAASPAQGGTDGEPDGDPNGGPNGSTNGGTKGGPNSAPNSAPHRAPNSIPHDAPPASAGAQTAYLACGPGSAISTTLVCGFIGCDRFPFNPLLATLPRLMHLPAGAESTWSEQFVRLAATESARQRPGSEALLERISEMMFVDAMRRHFDNLPEGSTGWLAGLRDRFVGRALALLHENPAAPWTIADLSRDAGLSRSALHERFTELVGQAPMQYLAQWRMQLAARMLRESQASIVTIALNVGYDSEAAFARAFKRLVGLSPAAWRRKQGQAATSPAPGAAGPGLGAEQEGEVGR